MMNERDKKLNRLFQKYIITVDEVIDECEDDEMYKALICKIAWHEMNEIYSWHHSDNHKKGEENA